MDIERIIETCKNRYELDYLFQITKIVAEADSVGESWGYCSNYTQEMFNNAEPKNEPEYGIINKYCEYLLCCGLPIYELYLKRIGIN